MSPREIVDYECRLRGWDVNEVRFGRRWPWLVERRRQIARVVRAAGYSFPEIGQAMGGRHHTSIMHLLGALGKRSVERSEERGRSLSEAGCGL